MSRRNSYRYREKKPISNVSMASFGVSLFTILVYITILTITVAVDGPSLPVFGGISVLCMFAALIVLVRGIRESHNDNFQKTSRVLGVVFPAIAFALWLGLYLVGIFAV